MGIRSGLILVIDQSTSATKAMLFEATTGMLVTKTSLEHRQIYPQPGWVEHNAQEIWLNVLRAVKDLLATAPSGSAEAVLFLSVTNQRETFVIFDRQSGRPLRNAIVWQCRRGESICDQLTTDNHDELVERKTGLRINTYFSAPKLAWVVQNEPGIASQLRDGKALIGTIDAYLIHRLTRGNVFATDHTNASRTLLYDIGDLRWDGHLCELFGVPPRALPEVRESSGAFGETDIEGLLPRPVPIRGVMGDSQAALFAQNCFHPGDAKVTFGTGSSVLLNIGPKRLPAAGGTLTSLAWVLGGQATYCFEGIINYAAATLAWLRDRVGLIDDFAEVEPLAISVPDNGGVYLVPAFAGMGAPYWDASARAAIIGLTAHSGREHLVRAAVEAIAYQLRDVLDMMRGQAGIDLRIIRGDGGATGNAFLMQFTADMTGLELRVAELPECSALGAALAGALGAGLFASIEDVASLNRLARSYYPSMPQARAQQNYLGWQRAVRCVLADQPAPM